MTYAEAKRSLAPRMEELCRQLLPNGTREGTTWRVGNIGGDRGQSLEVELQGPKAGLWLDRAGNDKGDAIHLIAQALKITNFQALQWVHKFLGIPFPAKASTTPKPVDPLQFKHPRHKDVPASAFWTYHDDQGGIIAYAVRYNLPPKPEQTKPRKVVIPFRWIGGRWRSRGWKKDDGENSPLYNLHHLVSRPSFPVLLVEGEKTAEAALRFFPTYICTTWQGGSESFSKADLAPLQGRDVVFWPDNDEPGIAVVDEVLASLPQARVVELPPCMPHKWDLADPVPEGIDVIAIEAAARKAPPRPQKEPMLPVNPDARTTKADQNDKPFRLPRSDDDFSQAFLDARRDRLRFCPDLESWLHFSPDQGWRRDETGVAYATLLEFARQLVVEGLEEAKKLEDPQTFVRDLTRLKDRRRLDPALHLSTTDPRIVVRALDLDSRPEVIACTNGIVDVLTGNFTPFDRQILVTRRLAVAFDPDAKAPIWDRFLSEVQPDPTMRAFLQRLLGSALFGAVRDHILPFHHGTGANGKSTALETVLDLFGGYGAKLTNSLVYATRNGASPYLELAGLFGARLAIGQENAQGGSLNEELLKAITGGDRVKGRFHHANFIEGPASYKVHLVGNHKPLIAGTDDGIWRRFVLIPWPVSIPPEQRDPLLRERITQEAPGLLNWLLQGCIAWNRDGLQIPDRCRALTNDFRQESDELADFIGETMTKDPESYCLKGEVYNAYKQWAEEGGLRPKTKRQLSTALQERGFESGRTSTTRDHSWIGWTLNQQ